MDDRLTKRRRFLAGAGASGTALLAGCSGFLGSDEADDGGDPDSELPGTDDESDAVTADDGGEAPDDDGIETGEGDTREVALVPQFDQLALQELDQELQAGEIEEEEYQERQEEIIQEGIDDLVALLEDETEITVDEEIALVGALRVTGDPFELVDALSSAMVASMVSAAELDGIEEPEEPDDG